MQEAVTMAQQPRDMQFDSSEMFALGAAAGAIVTAVITEYLERRKPKTPWEKAQARGAEALTTLSTTAKAGSERARGYVDAATDYVQDAIDITPKTKKRSKKRSKRKQGFGLKEAAAAAIGVSATTGVIDKVRDYASSATERVVGDPYAVSGSIKETLKERLGTSGSSNGHLTDKIQDASGSAFETLKSVATTAAESVKDYATTARESIKDVELGDKVRTASATTAETLKDYAVTARETIKDVKLGEKAKDYSATVVDTVKDYAGSARETLKEAELGGKVKDYATVAGTTVAAYSTGATKATSRAAKQSAAKLSESASYLAETTSEQATQLRKGTRKSVTRTRRRMRWGLRSFIIGLAIGILAAPQSGQRTRDSVTSFIENLLDVLMPENQRKASF
jgi:hypothetical protein